MTRSNLTILGNTAILNFALSGSRNQWPHTSTPSVDFTPLGLFCGGSRIRRADRRDPDTRFVPPVPDHRPRRSSIFRRYRRWTRPTSLWVAVSFAGADGDDQRGPRPPCPRSPPSSTNCARGIAPPPRRVAMPLWRPPRPQGRRSQFGRSVAVGLSGRPRCGQHERRRVVRGDLRRRGRIDGELTGPSRRPGRGGELLPLGARQRCYNASTATNYGALSLYGLYQAGPAYVSAITTPVMAAPASTATFRSRSEPLHLRGARRDSLLRRTVEAGYRMPVGKTVANVTPFAAFQPVTTLWLVPAPRASGTGFGAQLRRFDRERAAPLYLGLQLDGRWTDGSGAVYMPFLRAAWMHDFRSAPTGCLPHLRGIADIGPSRERPSRPCPMRWTCTWGSNPPRWERHPVRQPRCSACERLFPRSAAVQLCGYNGDTRDAVYPLVGRAVPRARSARGTKPGLTTGRTEKLTALERDHRGVVSG